MLRSNNHGTFSDHAKKQASQGVSGNEIQIFVKKTIVDVRQSETTRDIKSKRSEARCVIAMMTFDSKVLRESDAVKDCGMKDGRTVHIMEKRAAVEPTRNKKSKDD